MSVPTTETTPATPAADPTLAQLSTANALTAEERAVFNEHREAIHAAIAANADMTVRLMDIKNRKLYREDCGTWEEFCKCILQLTAVAVNNRIRAYQIREVLRNGEVDASLLPTEDRPYRPLFAVKSNDLLVPLFNKALELANGKPVTEDLMSKAIKACAPPTDDPPKVKTKKAAQALKLIDEMMVLLPTLDMRALPFSEILKIRELRNGLQEFDDNCQAAFRPRDIEVEAGLAESVAA